MRDWVFLRGLTREAAHWGAFPAHFEAALPGTRVHLIDLPGNGVRCQERSPATVAGMVTDARAQLQGLGIATPVHLLALSLGAMVATQWLHSAPQDIASAVLINTSMRPFSPLHHRLQPHNLATLAAIATGLRSDEAVETAVFRMTCQRADEKNQTVAHWVGLRRHHPVRPVNALRQLWAAARYRAPNRPPVVPLLLLNSTHDQLVDARCSRVIASAWDCHLDTHPWAGHDLPHDDPDWVIERVRDWLRAGRS
jgi:pimeloyl-ACP methyl ester carboxylesterase